MTNDIFTKKTPLVLAVGAALGLGMQTAWAEDGVSTPETKTFTLGSATGEEVLAAEVGSGESISFPELIQGYDKNPIVISSSGTKDTLTIKGGSFAIGKDVASLEFAAGITAISVEDGSFSNASETYVAGAALEVSGGTFTNSGTLTLGAGRPQDETSGVSEAGNTAPDARKHVVSGSAQFTNSGTLVLAEGNNLTIDFDNPAVPADEDAAAGKFSNTGTIKVNGATITIADSAIQESESEVVYEEAPKNLPVISMGNIEVNNGTVVNHNKGYLIQGEDQDDASQAQTSGSTVEPVPYSIVEFGNLTLNDSTFTSGEDARETGKTLTLNGTNAQAVFNGSSSWDALVIDEKPLTDSETDSGVVISEHLTLGAGAELSLKSLALKNLAGDHNTLESVIDGTSAADGKATSSVTITDSISITDFRNTSEQESSRTFTVNETTLRAEGMEIAGASLSISNTLEREDTRNAFEWESGQQTTDETGSADDSGSSIFEQVSANDVGILEITGYEAEKLESAEEGEESAENAAENEWTMASIGAVSASGTAQIHIVDINGGSQSTNADSGETTRPVYEAEVDSITLSETWYTAKADVSEDYLKPTETSENSETTESDLVDGKWDKAKYEGVVGDLTNFIAYNGGADGQEKYCQLDNKIENSHLQIGSLTIKKQELELDVSDIEIEGSANEGSSENETDAGKTVEVSSESVQHTAMNLTIEGSTLRIGTFDQQTGSVTIGGEGDQKYSEVIIDAISADGKTYSKLNGTLTFSNGMLALNANGIEREELYKLFGKTSGENDSASLTSLSANDKLVYVGNTVSFGEDARVGLGTTAPTERKETASATAENDESIGGSLLAIGAGTTIAMDGRNFTTNGLFAGSGEGAQLQLGVASGSGTGDGEKIKLVGNGFSVGAFNLAEGFQIVDADGEALIADSALAIFDVDDVKVDEAWGTVEGASVNADGQLVIGDTNDDGKVTTSEIAALKNIQAAALVDNVLAGNRAADMADQKIISSILSKVHKNAGEGDAVADFSTDQAVREINSITGFGAVAGLKAMTVDFTGYVQDQIEHHAYTIPHEMRGWWVQPIGTRMKTDDLRMGGLSTGYSIDTVGIMGGYDWTVPNGDIWGIAASYQSGDADGEGSALATTSDVKATSFHVWAARHVGDLRMMGAFTYMKTDSDATMTSSLGSLSSDELAATSVSFGVRADLTKTFGALKLVPHAGARVSMVDMDDFSVSFQNQEAFKFSEDKAWLFEVPVGVTAATAFEFQRWNVQPYVDLTVRGRFGDTDSTFTVTGASGASSKVAYDVSGDFIGDLRLGYMSTFQNLNLGMSYGFSAGDAGRQNHSLEATLRIDL